HTQAGKAPVRFQVRDGASAPTAPPLTKTVPFGFAPLPVATDQWTSSQPIEAAGAAAPERRERKLRVPSPDLSMIAQSAIGAAGVLAARQPQHPAARTEPPRR